jgi:hypothetical protein
MFIPANHFATLDLPEKRTVVRKLKEAEVCIGNQLGGRGEGLMSPSISVLYRLRSRCRVLNDLDFPSYYRQFAATVGIPL